MSPDSPLLVARSITKAFHGVPVLRGVSLRVEPGRLLGLVGENGAGKSTLMNIIGGVLRPDSGDMNVASRPYRPRHPREALRAGVALIHQELNLFGNLSIGQNLKLEDLPRRRLGGLPLPWIDHRALRDQARALLDPVGLDLDPDTPVGDLSPGRRQLVEIAKALGADPRVLILDEPTSSLSAPESARLFDLVRQLKSRGLGLILITHELGDVLRECDDVAVLRDGLLAGSGPAASYDRARLIREMVGRARDVPSTAAAGRAPGAPILEVRGLGTATGLDAVDLQVREGEVLGIAGLMGSGRTELARALFGLDPIREGSLHFRGRPFRPSPRASRRLGLAFVTEDRRREGLLPDERVWRNVALVALRRFARGRPRLVADRRLRRAVSSVLAPLRLKAVDAASQPARTLSGGNQQKVVLAKWLLDEPALFLLDEPTRGVDVAAKAEIHDLIAGLADRGAGVLLISSEIDELIGLSDRILVLAAGRLRGEFARDRFDRAQILEAAFAAGIERGDHR